jgi:acetyl-CoA decarbonylase/synthase complex subunit alpha
MSKKAAHLKIKELKTDIGVLKDLELSIGKIIEEKWTEPIGPTPFPSITDLREWDHKLLHRYKPLYMPFCDVCCLCTYGKCDLTENKRGACGIDIAAQQSRFFLLSCCIGAAAHAAHARHLVEHLIDKYGRKFPIDVGGVTVEVEAPITRLVCGIRPKILGDLEDEWRSQIWLRSQPMASQRQIPKPRL